MQFYWLRCRYAQGQFIYLWKPRTANLGDYWTKHHPRSHHKNIHSTVITPMKDLLAFWAIQLASTNRVQAQKKTQLNNIIQIKLMKKFRASNIRCECRLAAPHQGCDRLGNLTLPKIGKRHVSDLQDLKICGKYENLIEHTVEVNHRMQDRRLVPYL